MIEKNLFVEAVVHLFERFEEIQIFANKYSNSSKLILNHLGKKCREGDMRNQKCLYKLWKNADIQEEVRKLFETSERDLNEIEFVESIAGSLHSDHLPINDFVLNPTELESVEFPATGDSIDLDPLLDDNALFNNNQLIEETEELQSTDVTLTKETASNLEAPVGMEERPLITEPEQIEIIHEPEIQMLEERLNIENLLLNKRNDDLQKELSRATIKFESDLEANLLVIEEQKQQIARHQATISIFDSKVAELLAQNKKLEEEVTNLLAINADLTNSLRKKRNQTSKLKEEIQVLIENSTTAENNKYVLEEKNREVEALNQLISQKNNELNKIEKSKADLEVKLEVSVKNADHAKDEICQLQEEYRNLQAKMSLLEQNCEQISASQGVEACQHDQSIEGSIGDSELKKASLLDETSQLLLNVQPNEDIIQCICGLFREEGKMIQCPKCMHWQHLECVESENNTDSYLCHRCDPREITSEIPLNEYTDEGYRYYVTLMRGDLQVRQTDTVYVLRGAESESSTSLKRSYKTVEKFEYSDCDIFRVEHLWKDLEGNRFLFGHNYYRPHETYYKPSRRFYTNELVRVPIYEVVPIDLVMGRCWVLDPVTYCKGRPIDCDESHLYICEWSVDKTARNFSKISKQKYPVCTKSYAFNNFEEKLKISRDYMPHQVASRKKKTEETSNAVQPKVRRR